MRSYTTALVAFLVIPFVIIGCDSGGGAVPGDLGESTTVAFTESDVEVGEDGGTYSVDLEIADPGFKVVPVNVSFNASQSTATLGEDLQAPSDTTIQFPESATSGNARPFAPRVVDDNSIEDNETAVFDLTVADSAQASVGEPSRFTLAIADNDVFEVFANAQDLEPSSGNTDAHCIVQRSTGEMVFFNSSEGGIFSYDNGLNVERSSGNLNSDISAESNTIDRCGGVAKDANDNVYFLFRASESSGPTYVYKLPASGGPSVLASQSGLGSITHTNGTVYLAGVQFDGAPEDGFYSVDDSGTGQSVSTVALDPNLDLGYGMDADADGNLYAFSGGFGGGSRALKIVRVTDPTGSATLEEFVDPYRSGSPLIADSGENIGDVDVVSRNGEEFLVVYNGSFEAEDGEQWASIRVSDQSIDLLFDRVELIENTSANDFVSGFTEPVAVNNDGEIFVASRAASFGGEHYIARSVDQLP